MTKWDEYLTDLDNPELDTNLSEDIRDAQAEVEAQETEAILAGDAEAAEALDSQWKTLEETADHTEAAEQDLQWAQESLAEAQTDAEAAAHDAATATAEDPRFIESAQKEMEMSDIAAESALADIDESIAEYDAAADAVDTGTSVDEY